MAVKLNYDIAPSNLELIRDRIGIILKEELDNQATRQADELLTAEIFTERYTPPDEQEDRIIIIGIDRGTYEHQTSLDQRADFNFTIDIYTKGKQSQAESGYLNSSKKLHRLAGLVRSIIMAPVYVRLGFDTSPIIARRSVNAMAFDPTNDQEDMNYFRMVRIVLKVEFCEEQPAEIPTEAAGYDTQVKIELTEKGYKFILNN